MNFELLKNKASDRGITEIEIFSQQSDAVSFQLFDGIVDKNEVSITEAVCVRGVYNGHLGIVCTEDTGDEVIDFVLDGIIANASLISKDEPFYIYGGDNEYPEVPKKEQDFDSFKTEDKLSLCKKIDTMLREKCPDTFSTEVGYEEGVTTTAIVNSNGLDLTKNTKSAYVVAELCVRRGDEAKSSYDFLHINRFGDIELDKFTDKIIEDAVSTFGAGPVASGSYDVVLDSGVVRDLLGAYSGLFCADRVIKKMSFLDGKIGEKIFGDNITIIDDPISPEAERCVGFDDEGVAARKKTVVENGVLKTYLHNLSTAAMMGEASTGNGFKGGVSSNVAVSPYNFYLKAGDRSLDELFARADNGIYLTSITGLHAGVNPVSGDFSLQSSGYVIRDGKKCEPVTLIIVSSSIQRILSSVDSIGSDFKFKFGIGAPSVLVRGVDISGK